MSEAILTAAEQRILTRFRQAPEYEKPLLIRSMAWIQMGVPVAKCVMLYRRELALARAKAHHGNVIVGPWDTAS